MKRDERKDFFRKIIRTPQNRQMNKPNMFRKKKIPFGRIIPPYFSFESSESDRVFNYLRDSNSTHSTEIWLRDDLEVYALLFQFLGYGFRLSTEKLFVPGQALSLLMF